MKKTVQKHLFHSTSLPAFTAATDMWKQEVPFRASISKIRYALIKLKNFALEQKELKAVPSKKQHIPAALQVLLAEITGQETEKSCDRDSSWVDQGFRWVSHTHIFTESTALSSGAAGLIPTPILWHHFCCSRKLGIQNKPYFSSLWPPGIGKKGIFLIPDLLRIIILQISFWVTASVAMPVHY